MLTHIQNQLEVHVRQDPILLQRPMKVSFVQIRFLGRIYC